MRLAVLPLGTARPLGAAPATAIATPASACISTTHASFSTHLCQYSIVIRPLCRMGRRATLTGTG
jgi:hypothetical protein